MNINTFGRQPSSELRLQTPRRRKLRAAFHLRLVTTTMGAAASAATYDSIEEALPNAPYQSEEGGLVIDGDARATAAAVAVLVEVVLH